MRGFHIALAALLFALIPGCNDDDSGYVAGLGDVTAPADVTDLRAGSPTSTSLTLRWTAPSDGSMQTSASQYGSPSETGVSQYDIRYSLSDITVESWDSATPVGWEGQPKDPGETESALVGGLYPATDYFFALKAADEAQNWSRLSNCVMGRTLDPQTCSISGSVVTNSGTPLALVEVRLFSMDNTMIGITFTSAQGTYLFPDLRLGSYILLTGITDYPVNPAQQLITLTGLDVQAGDFMVTMGMSIQGTVHNGDGPLGNVLVRLFTCYGVHTGISTYTEDDGSYVIEPADPGDYFLDFIHGGCTDARDPASGYFAVAEGEQVERSDIVYMTCDSEIWASVVLTWGALPTDLDLHLWTPQIEGCPYHVYYSTPGSQGTAPYAELDHDDVTSYGPECTTIYQDFPGTYTYAVYRYSSSGSLTTSDAAVRILAPGGLVIDLEVPTVGEVSDRWWHICTIDGTTGEVTVINELHPNQPALPFGLPFTTTPPSKEQHR